MIFYSISFNKLILLPDLIINVMIVYNKYNQGVDTAIFHNKINLSQKINYRDNYDLQSYNSVRTTENQNRLKFLVINWLIFFSFT